MTLLEKKAVEIAVLENKSLLVSEYLLWIRETVYETNVDFMFREVNTIIDKLIEQGLIAGVGKFDAKANDGYFLGYFFVSKVFRVFNTTRQQIKETYHVTFDESIEAIRQYKIDSNISYYVIPHGRSLSELTQENQVPEVNAPNEPDIPHIKDNKDHLDLINTEGTHEQNVKNNQTITQPTDVPSGNNTKDRWLRDQHIELVNIIGDLGEGMLTRSMAAKLTLPQLPPDFESSEFLDYVCFDLKGYSNSDYAGCNMDEKAPQVHVKYLVENWFIRVPRNSSQWLCPQLKMNILLLLGVVETSNVVGNFNYPPNVSAYKPIMKFLLNCPLNKAFTNCSSVVYQNFLREFWSSDVAYDPFPSTDETEQCPLKEFLIKFSVLNRQRPLTLNFNTFCSSTGLDYNNVKYVAHHTSEAVKKELGKITINLSYWTKLQFLPDILSNFNFTKDPSKVIDIELTAHMIAINNRMESMSPFPLTSKLKKGKSQTVTLTLPKSQGPEASGALSKKKQKPKSKKPPTETKVTPPKPTEGSKQSSLVPLGTVPYPQDLERNIQLASTRLPSILDEGTRKSQPLPEGTATHPKDSGGHIQPLDRDLTSTFFDEGTAKITSRPKGLLGDKDSGGNIPPTTMEPIHSTIVDLSGTGAKYQVDETQSTRLRDQSDKLVESTMNTIDKSSKAIKDIYQGLNVIIQLLKEINNAIKDDPATNKKLDKAIKTFAKISTNTTKEVSAAWTKSYTNMAWNLGSRITAIEISQTALKCEVSYLRQENSEIKSIMIDIYHAFKGQPSSAPSSSVTSTAALTNIPSNVKGENATNTATEEPPSHIEEEIKDLKMAIPISSINHTKVPPNQAQPITIITTHLESSQAALRKEKGLQLIQMKIPQRNWKAIEEARLLAISKPKVIKVVQEEAKKIRLDLKKIASAKAGEQFKKAQDAKHQVLKRENNDKRNFNVHQQIKFTDFKITKLDELGPIIQKKKNSIVKDLMTSLRKRYERVRVDSIVSYMVIASIVKTEENARFFLKLRKLIADHPDQEKLKSKKVKLEALGYQID
nr:retrovirus-related Pol polyprotein from transposon TNT 1-94 [Tanacetum cinerariifolium]